MNNLFKLSRNKKTILSVKDQSVKNVVIPEGITAIGRYAFGRCENLQSVKMPNGVKTISMDAFCNCI